MHTRSLAPGSMLAKARHLCSQVQSYSHFFDLLPWCGCLCQDAALAAEAKRRSLVESEKERLKVLPQQTQQSPLFSEFAERGSSVTVRGSQLCCRHVLATTKVALHSFCIGG